MNFVDKNSVWCVGCWRLYYKWWWCILIWCYYCLS